MRKPKFLRNPQRRRPRRMSAAARFDAHMLKAGVMIAEIAHDAAEASKDRIRDLIDLAIGDLRTQLATLRAEVVNLRAELGRPPGRLWKEPRRGRT